MSFYSIITSLSRPTKRRIFLAIDGLLIPACLLAAFLLRYGTLTPPEAMRDALALFAIVTVTGAITLIAFGVHRIKLGTFEGHAASRIGLASITLAIYAVIVSYSLQLGTPRSVPVIFGALFFVSAVSIRLMMLVLLRYLRTNASDHTPVAIYGAGPAGIQLASVLSQNEDRTPVVFIDNAKSLHGLMIAGIPVKGASALPNLVSSGRIRQVVIAQPDISESKRQRLISSLEDLNVDVRVLPSIADILDRKSTDMISKTVTPDQLLGRDKVDLQIPEIGQTYSNRTVMVTGAGGSIGSELARQLLDCDCAKIVLFDHSEFALYSIEREISALTSGQDFEIVARLGSVTNAQRVRSVMQEENVEIVLHAAAYKHVPLVEDNVLEGSRNNVLGTLTVAEAAAKEGLERFILISTDKAVRPTNIMGATKRLAELVIQDLQTRYPTTRFTMVRFGNVLGSSGSVLPLFQRQIAMGGPVTVTHAEVTRFFMTIPEAARLVLLAGAFAKGSDVFVLDMGKPMKILDIAKRMIEMSAQKVSVEPDDGGIEIQITGLRPGEKLYEELLIDDKSLVGTPHPKILRAQETYLPEIQIAAMLKRLRKALENNDASDVRDLVRDYVDGYHQQSRDEAI
ncbi:nucleoside-diphosphate sugar epimerase/dehydratase [Nereida sp. MMG025]|uniref:polysaccharide biosynthesis protein n=1 Tax=Nereida sp. MMG025 TaxID=2909981 RepID=UPI001F28B826|nr:nucleoside-diphosphate sugar epimerase/dehydratase [Nereida sp. MMG025]MCF6444724.1 polysaccharide biosynthesis protein [Nereida sp. MMG025]